MQQETISIIITILNGAKWIDNCFERIGEQTAVPQKHPQPQTNREREESTSLYGGLNRGIGGDLGCLALEVCVFDDCSTDNTPALLRMWKDKFKARNINLKIKENRDLKPRGVGYGRNQAISIATGSYLCFQDIDDEMLPQRITKQYALARQYKNAIVGSKFTRSPQNSTCRFSRWANNLEASKLSLQIYTSNGPTVIMPTWFCHRAVYTRVPGGFCEDGYGIPEDLLFFYKHLDLGGSILRSNECLLSYPYHVGATTFSVAANTIWHIRLKHLIRNVLCRAPWKQGFTIWNAGKQGRKLFRDLPPEEKLKVLAFCDVDQKKIHRCYQHYDVTKRVITHSIPIVHFTETTLPLLICMKLDLTNGGFEANLQSLNLTEGRDYILFT